MIDTAPCQAYNAEVLVPALRKQVRLNGKHKAAVALRAPVKVCCPRNGNAGVIAVPARISARPGGAAARLPYTSSLRGRKRMSLLKMTNHERLRISPAPAGRRCFPLLRRAFSYAAGRAG